MFSNKLIRKEISSLEAKTSVKQLIDIMQSLEVSHYPIQNHGIFWGMIYLEDLFSINENDTILEHLYLLQPFFIREDFNGMQLYENFYKNDANILPVLSFNNKFLGCILLKDMSKITMQIPMFKEEGCSLIISTPTPNYSLGEVARIVENGNGKLLGVFITEINAMRTEISLKFNALNINDIIQTFRRFDYEIVSKHSEDLLAEELKDHSEYFDKYLNI